ncbi:MAG: TfoX/Sxy family protein [Oscillospiraceae bacterium]|nr:TfoX/Sxy family protein [Oscillospiraceae bacterium]
MASSKEYLNFILDQLSGMEDISYKIMMGEYILYYKSKIFGGIYDNRLLVKPVKSAVDYIPNSKYELPYEGAKEMLLIDNVDSREYLIDLIEGMYEELPTPKNKKK